MMFDIRSILSSKLFVGAVVVITLLVVGLYISAKVIDYKNSVIDEKNENIRQHEIEKEMIKESIPVILFEQNNSTSFRLKKEDKYEKVHDTIGVHTIVFD